MARNGLTQQALGTYLGVSHRAVGKWLAGDSRPGAALVVKLAERFELSVDLLTDDTRDLPIYEVVARMEEAKAVAERWPADQPKIRQEIFTRQLERAHHAMHLREAAKRLRGEADRLDALAAEIRTGDNLPDEVVEKVTEQRDLRVQKDLSKAPDLDTIERDLRRAQEKLNPGQKHRPA